MDYTNEIKKYIELEIETLKKLDIQAINAAANLIDETRKAGNTIYIFGNGGSSATASHYQNDFNKGVSEYLFNKNEPKFKKYDELMRKADYYITKSLDDNSLELELSEIQRIITNNL